MNPFATLIFIVAAICCSIAAAQENEDVRGAGNGIEVESDGGILPLSKEKSEAFGKLMADVLEPIPDSLNKNVPLRKVSLKKLDANIKKIVSQYEVFPDSVRYLGGLTSIKYLIVLPEENDLLLVGPAEGWRTNASGNVIGNQTGRPILLLEDFLTLFRTLNRQTNSSEVITCSIDPAPETQAKLAKLHQQYSTINDQNAGAYSAALEESYGKLPITIAGIPATSRFANVLVAADFKIKRIALGLEPAQARNIPSYVSLVAGSRSNVTPRFWLVPEYAAVSHDSKKLTYQLGDIKVKVFSEDDYFTSRLSTKQTGNTDRAGINWCSKLEENYDNLAKAQPVFGELRNGMSLAMIAALIRQENLLQKANCKLTILMDESKLKLVTYPQPKTAASKSVLSKNGYSVVVACGGIEIKPFNTLRNNLKLDSKIDTERAKLIQTQGDDWWSP